MATDPFQHFVDAQNYVWPAVQAELQAGRKRTHWMWFVFPQHIALGRSVMAERFGIASLEDAVTYSRHPLLGPRLRHCTRLVLDIDEKQIGEIFGFPDDRKFQSCMTLFDMAEPDETIFKQALQKYFAGQSDINTLELMNADRV